MKGDIVARRYAHALFSLGREGGEATLDLYGEALSSLAELTDSSPELARAFRAPVISAAEKRDVIVRLLGLIGPAGEDRTVRDFCLLLTDKGRLPLLRDIAACFNALLDAEKGVLRGELATAVPLNKKRRTQAVATLEKQINKKLVLRFEVDPTILGGMVLRIGDTVLDASLRAQLNSLRDTIKRGM